MHGFGDLGSGGMLSAYVCQAGHSTTMFVPPTKRPKGLLVLLSPPSSLAQSRRANAFTRVLGLRDWNGARKWWVGHACYYWAGHVAESGLREAWEDGRARGDVLECFADEGSVVDFLQKAL